MTPETFIALLLVICVLGLGGLGTALFFLRKIQQQRHEALTHLLDQLDERTIHENRTLEKKTDEVRKEIEISQAALRKNVEAQVLESRESWQKGYDEIKRILENLVAEQQHLRQNLETDLAEKFNQGLQNMAVHHERQTALLAGYDEQVQRVRMRNELQVAITYFHSGEPAKALEVLTPLIAEDPDNRDAVLLAARAGLSSGQPDQGAAILESALIRFPGDPDLLAEFARLRSVQGNANERTRLIAEGLVRHPEHPRLRFERALFHIEKKNYPAAKEDLLVVLENEDDSAEVHYNLGIVEMHLDNVPGAIQQFRKSISLSPGSADGNHALGLALIAGESYAEAVDFLSRARNLKPENIRARLDLASALRLAGSPEEAIKECRVARKLDPRVPRTELEEALARHDHAEFREALEVLDNLLQWQPAYKNARRLKAEILMETERLEEAVREWSILAEQSPDDPDLKVALAEAVKRNGQIEAALGWFELAARMAPGNSSIQIRFAKEALAHQKFERVEEAIERGLPLATTPEIRLQLVELRMLMVLKDGKFSHLDRLVIELKRILEAHPEAIPLDKGLDLEGQALLGLGLSKEASKVHNALVDLYDGQIDFETFDEIVTHVMRALLSSVSPKPEAAVAQGGDNGQATEESPAVEDLTGTGAPLPPTEEESIPLEPAAEVASPAPESLQTEQRMESEIAPSAQPDLAGPSGPVQVQTTELPGNERFPAGAEVEGQQDRSSSEESATGDSSPVTSQEEAQAAGAEPDSESEDEVLADTEGVLEDPRTSTTESETPAGNKRSKKSGGKKRKKNSTPSGHDT